MTLTAQQKKVRADRARQWRKDHPRLAKKTDRKYREKYKEKRKRYVQSWRERDANHWSKKKREYNLRYSYGLTVEAYDALLQQQKGQCALCGTSESGTRSGVLVVDHDHKTGRVRGLLCKKCNSALGYLRHNVSVLSKAIEYLSRE